MAKISDALLMDLLTCFRLKQVSLAIEVLRGRITADQLAPLEQPGPELATIQARADSHKAALERHMRNQDSQLHAIKGRIEVRRLDEKSDLGHGDHEEGEYA